MEDPNKEKENIINIDKKNIDTDNNYNDNENDFRRQLILFD